MESVEEKILRQGRELFGRVQSSTPKAFDPRNVTGQLMNWSMENEALKTQLFRLVDVLPALQSSSDVSRHIQEYLGNGASREVPFLLRMGSKFAGIVPWFATMAARKGVREMARQFIVAENASEAIDKLRSLREDNLAFTADLLGESVVSEKEAEHYLARYRDLLETLSREAHRWPEIPQLDLARHGSVPRVNISVKISAMYSQFRPVDPSGAIDVLFGRLKPLLLRARELGAFINFDMESTSYKPVTLELFMRLLEENDLSGYPHFGIALQAYLKDSRHDLETLIRWAKSRRQRITIRLIKGAYWDYEMALAAQRNWPVPVWEHKAATDHQYEQLAQLMLREGEVIDAAFGTHNVRSIAACLAWAEQLGRPQNSFEFQMLYGMAEPIKQALTGMGFRVRDYAPIGEVLPGMCYLVRRLLENSSNEGFLRASYGERASADELLKPPVPPARERIAPSREPVPFRNTPLTDWTIGENRFRMQQAVARIRKKLGEKYPLVIGGRKVETTLSHDRCNPARRGELVGTIAEAGVDEAAKAIEAAEGAWTNYRRTTVEERAQLTERLASILDQRRYDLAALEMFETGKNWVESDADVAEAIDFCRFYALEMRRIARSNVNLPGEHNLHEYIPRGIGVVIAPWNFPLAILCGMTVAGLVTGNCVIIKPAETSAIIASEFARALADAGFPQGTFAYLPGPGSVIGKFLVEHPKIEFVAFTGSRAVGLDIYRRAGETTPGQLHLKKVVCEMGGKNALILDSDADLDEAIPAIVQSAFGYQGQKCSALSRLICLPENYDHVLDRLVEASRSLVIGLPEDPATALGPVIDEKAFQRIRDYIEIGKSEARLLFEGTIPAGLDGFYIPPTIFADVPVKARIVQEEIFGPVLAVLKANDFTQALEFANDSHYALTGGLFSRSPDHIDQARREFRVGNLYINRTITGALVNRQPFGGFKMSGGGTKAGGPDYLYNFLYMKVITENTMRRGFAPLESGE